MRKAAELKVKKPSHDSQLGVWSWQTRAQGIGLQMTKRPRHASHKPASRNATTASASITKRTPKLPDFAKTGFLVKRMSKPCT